MTQALRSVRLIELRDLFRANPAGFTPRQLASMTDVSLRTIQRDLLVLQTEAGVPLLHDNGRYYLMREERLDPLPLSLQEARAMLIAVRLFLRYSDEGDPHAAMALKRLARVMPEAVREQVIAAAESLGTRPLDPEFSRNMATITDAWARRRSLRISYRSAGHSRQKDVVVDPYFLEPSAAGFATYLIAYSQTHQQIRTFKIERIVSAHMLPQAFDIAPGLNIDELLSSAWGIIWGEGQQVRLRFAPDVTWRVKESRWHPSQSIEDLSDGGCIVTLSVASMMEIGRWVRSWGDKVEVLAPVSLRDELREEAVRTARMYTTKPKPIRRATGQRPGSVA